MGTYDPTGKMFYIVIFGVLSLCVKFISVRKVGSWYPATKGNVWPKPQHEEKHNTTYFFDPENFIIKPRGLSYCLLLRSTIDRYKLLLKQLRKGAARGDARRTEPGLRELRVRLDAPCDEYPRLGMDESYNLTVAESATLVSNSIWGIMRGFETFSQLIYHSENYEDLQINATIIYDYPSYSHRGLMLDTSRHFITMKNILLTLDAMAMNKMNVFHWHIVDDESFPYQSERFPELSKRGAYHPSMVYTKADIQAVVQYARERGIRVLPEIDMPGHTRSWGVAYPNILTECFSKNKVTGLGPMNPINESTYQLLGELIAEVQRWFPDLHFHVGGDEVDMGCWKSNPTLRGYMAKYKMSNVKQLHALFMSRVIPLLGNRSKPIVWQEVFDEDIPLPPGALVQVWKWGHAAEINKILKSGHKVLFSSSWYLDNLKNSRNWEMLYKADPRTWVTNARLARAVVGGEACMWGEAVDDRNLMARVWPRASAAAEVLWSSPVGANLTPVKSRLEEHACRMVRRGVPAQPPNGSGFCLVN